MTPSVESRPGAWGKEIGPCRKRPTAGFDAAVLDREDQPIALVEVKVQPVANWAAILRGQLAKLKEPIAFIVAVDPNSILLYRSGGETLGEPIVRLDTLQVLQHYDPKLPGKRVFEAYMVTLVEAWLRDLAYHWKSEQPPGSEELGSTGLLERIDRGTTETLGD